MQVTQESLQELLGPDAEMCAGSFLITVDGVKHEVATANLHTGAYTLSALGEELVRGKEAPATGNKGAKKAGVQPIDSLTLPGVADSLDKLKVE